MRGCSKKNFFFGNALSGSIHSTYQLASLQTDRNPTLGHPTKHADALDPLSRAEEGEPVLLSSVSPSLFVVLGAVSASVILLTVVMAALYVR